MTSKPPFFAQERYDTCAVACLRMILAYYGTEISEAELVRMTVMDEGGVDIEELARVARRCGLLAEILSFSENQVIELIAERRWVIPYLNRWPFDRGFCHTRSDSNQSKPRVCHGTRSATGRTAHITPKV